MSTIQVIRGNIFRTQCQTIVNTVNCVGVMGAGLAYECRLRYPDMYRRYAELCKARRLTVGTLWIYRTPERWVLNFPTKSHWKLPSKPAYLEAGLRKFMDTYQAQGITSVAFPLLGAQNGGLDADTSLRMLQTSLAKCAIPVEIYDYDPQACDDVFERFKTAFLTTDEATLKEHAHLGAAAIHRVREGLEDASIRQLSQLLRVRGVGDKTLEKCFAFVATKDAATDVARIPFPAPTQRTLEL